MRTPVAAFVVLSSFAFAIACGSSSNDAPAPPNDAGTGDAVAQDAGDTGTAADAAPDAAASWTPSGLDGNIVYAVAADPKNASNVFATLASGGADKGVFRTKDAGKSWSKLGGGLPDLASGLVVIHPQSGTLLVNPGAAGIYRSTDGGDTWTQSSFALGSVSGLVFHPTAATAWTVTSQDGVEKSTDGGATWTKTANTNLPLNAFALGPLAFDGAKLYLGTEASGVYVSTDGGDTWTKGGAGLPDGANGGSMLGVAATASRPGVVFVETFGGGVFRSDDSAATFTKMDTGANATRYGALRIDPATTTTLWVSASDTNGGVGGLLRSTDDGKSWSLVGPNTLAINAVDLAPDGTAYAGTIGKGVWRLAK